VLFSVLHSAVRTASFLRLGLTMSERRGEGLAMVGLTLRAQRLTKEPLSLV
jgi:hypothetical protein